MNGLLCRVTNSVFCAGAVFEKIDGKWQCTRAAPILKWWVGHPIENIRTFMTGPAKKRGWAWEWMEF